MQDYSAFIKRGTRRMWRSSSVMIPPMGHLLETVHQQGFIPKAATIGKAILFHRPWRPRRKSSQWPDLRNLVEPSHPFKSSLSGKTASSSAMNGPRRQEAMDTAHRLQVCWLSRSWPRSQEAQNLDKAKVREAMRQQISIRLSDCEDIMTRIIRRPLWSVDNG